MKRVFIVGLFIIVAATIGCGGAQLLESPQITMVIMDTASVTVAWMVDPVLEDNVDFQGYNIYVATDSSELLVESGEELNKVNADVVTDTVFEIPNLSPDSIYFVQVRTVNSENKVGSYNDIVPFVIASPRPEFVTTVIFEMNTPGVDDSCALRLSDAMLMADSAMAQGGADLWVDVFPVSSKDTVAFASPSHSDEWGTGARVSRLLNIGQYSLDSVSVAVEPTDTTSVPVEEGDLVIVKTEDSNYVKIHVDGIDKNNNRITVSYAYQNIPNLPYFAP